MQTRATEATGTTEAKSGASEVKSGAAQSKSSATEAKSDTTQGKGGATEERGAGDVAATLLIEAGDVLASSLEPSTTIRQVAELTVPRLADLCVIDLCDDDGLLSEVAVACPDEGVRARLEELRATGPLHRDGAHPVAQVIKSGKPMLLERLDDTAIKSFASCEDHAEFMLEHRYDTAIVAPLVARSRTLGAISVLRLGNATTYNPTEMELTCELARRAALAIDNARLYSNLRVLEQRFEAILVGLAEAVTVVNREGQMIFANRAAIELLGNIGELAERAPGTVSDRVILLDEHGAELSLEQLPGRRLLRGASPEPRLVHTVPRGEGEEKWLMVRASPIYAPEGQEVLYAVSVFENITEVKRAQVAERFLADASRALSTSLDSAETIDRIATLAVPQLADLCEVSLLDSSGEIALVSVHHNEQDKAELARRLGKLHPPRKDDLTGVAEVLRSGTAIHAEVHPVALATYGGEIRQQEVLSQLGITTMIVVPIVAGGRILGAVRLASTDAGRRLTPSDLGLAEEFGRRAGVALENARLYTERVRIASELQQALLPEALPKIEGVQLAARYAAAGELNEVGGDFYDVIEHKDGRLVLTIGDVCGKGPRAAAVTALVRHTVRAGAAGGQAPRMLLASVHQALRTQPPGLDMCTLGVVLVDLHPMKAHLTVVLGGHPQPLLIGVDGTVKPIGRPGTVLGVIDPLRIEQASFEMGPGETLLLYTDGVSEAGAPDHQLGEDGLSDICAKAAGMALDALLPYIERAAVERAGGSARDDIALLAMRLCGADPPR